MAQVALLQMRSEWQILPELLQLTLPLISAQSLPIFSRTEVQALWSPVSTSQPKFTSSPSK
jgi:hypothetical protein